MKVTAQEEYGLRCLLQVAAAPESEPVVTLTEIARREGLTVPHVAKLMGTLRNGGLVESVRGRSGGYSLTRPADQISLLDVLSALGERLFDSEYCGRYTGPETQECVHVSGCAIRSVWSWVEAIASDVLRRTTLAELLRLEERALSRSLDDRRRLTVLPIEPR